MNTADFYNLKGLKETDIVEVGALQLQGFMREMQRLSGVEKILEETEKENNALRDELEETKEALAKTQQLLEECYDRNEVLFNDNMNKAAMIKTYKKQMGQISDIATNNSRLKREHKEMKEKLYTLQALSAYRANERKLSSYADGNGGGNIKVNLDRY